MITATHKYSNNPPITAKTKREFGEKAACFFNSQAVMPHLKEIAREDYNPDEHGEERGAFLQLDANTGNYIPYVYVDHKFPHHWQGGDVVLGGIPLELEAESEDHAYELMAENYLNEGNFEFVGEWEDETPSIDNVNQEKEITQ